MTTQSKVDALCRKIYQEVSNFDPISNALSYDIGFEILMGKPFYEPHVLFIGYQPGDGNMSPLQAREAGYERDWVSEEKCQFATESWMLARKIRSIFGDNNLHILERCVGINALYIRAKNINEYNTVFDYKSRKIIKSFCKAQNEKIIKAIKPNKIIVLGFGTMDIFGNSNYDIVDDKGKPITKIAEIFGVQSLVVKHLTGARFSKNEYLITTQRIRNFLNINFL